MMKKLAVIFALVSMMSLASCNQEEKPSDAWQAKDMVVSSLSALYAGDTDSYLRHAYYGEHADSVADSVKVMLMRVALKRYVENINSRGGVASVVPIGSRKETDSVYFVDYALNFNDGTKEQCIRKVRFINGEWRICVTE